MGGSWEKENEDQMCLIKGREERWRDGTTDVDGKMKEEWRETDKHGEKEVRMMRNIIIMEEVIEGERREGK